MAIKIAHASSDERGKYNSGKAGDQTGREVYIRTWYNRPWNKVVRPNSIAIADKIVKAAIDGCNNPNIGYDQFERTTLYTQAQKVGFDLSRITKPCETDCSAFVAVCVNAAGIKVSKDIYTGNMVRALSNTGQFKVLTASKYLKSDRYLRHGDILVYEGHHTAIVIEDGECEKPAAPPPAPQPKKSGWYNEDDGWRFYLGNTGDYVRSDWYQWTGKDGNRYWSFFLDNGFAVCNDWYEYKDDWYFFNADCVMRVSTWIPWKGRQYYVDSAGHMVKGTFVKSADKELWHYIDENGVWDSSRDTTRKPANNLVSV